MPFCGRLGPRAVSAKAVTCGLSVFCCTVSSGRDREAPVSATLLTSCGCCTLRIPLLHPRAVVTGFSERVFSSFCRVELPIYAFWKGETALGLQVSSCSGAYIALLSYLWQNHQVGLLWVRHSPTKPRALHPLAQGDRNCSMFVRSKRPSDTLRRALPVVNAARGCQVFGVYMPINSFLLMFGNWSQHMFINPECPRSAYGYSYNILNSAENLKAPPPPATRPEAEASRRPLPRRAARPAA